MATSRNVSYTFLMRLPACLALLCFCVCAFAQTFDKSSPPNHEPLPTINPMHLNVGGTAVDLTFSFEDQGTVWTTGDVCSHPCLGHKHALHEQCNLSCDGPCTALHAFLRETKISMNSAPFSDQLHKQIGAGADASAASIARSVAMIASSTISGANLSIDYRSKHYNTTPCSSQEREFPSRIYKINANWTASGQTTTSGIGYMGVPERGFRDTTPMVACMCSLVRVEMPTRTATLTNIKGQTGLQYPNYGEWRGGMYCGTAFGAHLGTTQEQENYGIGFKVPDMNHFIITGQNSTNEMVNLVIPPGTILRSGNPKYQSVVTVEPVMMNLPPHNFMTMTFNIDHGPLGADEGEQNANGRVQCINMNLLAPQEDVPFTMEGPSNPVLSLLANYFSHENFKGPLGQVRTWIVTDRASMDEQRKHLIPGPNESGYLSALYIVEHVGGLDLGQPEYKNLLEPKLVSGPFVTEEAVDWFVEKMSHIDAKGLAQWIKQNPNGFQRLWQPDNGQYGPEHAGQLASALCGSWNEDLQESGLDFLANIVPEDQRAKLLKTNITAAVGGVLLTGKPGLAVRALDVIALYKDKASAAFLASVSANAPQDVKDRAADLLKQSQGW